jgi:membrane-anchored glycerophosphoryl diester phosphodiesterase (GDPDase)
MIENTPKSKKEITTASVKLYMALFNKLWPVSLVAALITRMLLYITPHGPHELKSHLSYFLVGILVVCLSSIFWAMMLKIIDSNDKANYIKKAFDESADKILQLLIAVLLMYLSTMIGFVLLIIPGFYIGFMNFCILPLIILDNMGVKQAFITSWSLVRGNWWHVTLSYFRAIIIPAVIIVFIEIIGLHFLPAMVNDILLIAIKTALFPYIAVLIYVIFNDLKCRKANVNIVES